MYPDPYQQQAPSDPGRRRTLIVIIAMLSVALMLIGATLIYTLTRDDDQPAAQVDSVRAPAAALPPQETTTTVPPEQQMNERGYIPVSVGDEVMFGEPPNNDDVRFTIDKITVDPPCHEFGTRSDGMHTLLLKVRVATGQNRASTDLAGAVINPWSFAEIGKDGITTPAQAGMCTDYTKAIGTEFGVGQKYRGTIEVEVPKASGRLVLRQQFTNGDGWEWTYKR